MSFIRYISYYSLSMLVVMTLLSGVSALVMVGIQLEAGMPWDSLREWFVGGFVVTLIGAGSANALRYLAPAMD